MKSGPGNNGSRTRPGRIAGLHRQGASWRVVLLVQGGGQYKVSESLSVAVADAAALDQALSRLRPDLVVGVIPAGQTVWRGVDAAPPIGSAAEVAAALDLVAEAHTPTGTPAYRRGAGLVPLASNIGAMAAVAWTGSLEGWPGALVAGVDAWAPEPACLGALAAATGRAPGAAHVSTDRPAGVVAMVGVIAPNADQVPPSPAKAVIRVSREDGADPQGWTEAVRAVVEEVGEATGLGTDHVDPQTSRDYALLLGPVENAPTIAGIGDQEAWLDQYGLATGAAAMAAMEPGSAVLAMRATAPAVRRSPVEATLNWLSRPSRAAAVVAMCVLVLLLGPLAVAYSRLSVLKSQAAGADVTKADYLKAAEEAEFYSVLRERRLPVVKTLAELTGNAPSGIIIESVTVDRAKVTVRGTTESSELVSRWRASLRDSKIFDDVRTPTIEAGASPIQFDLEATIGQPLLAFAPGGKGDVAATPLPDLPSVAGGTPTTRRTGESARDTSREGTRSTGATGNNRSREGRTTRGNNDGARSGETAAKGPAAPSDPGPISDEQIQRLDLPTTLREFSQRRAAAVSSQVDETARQRLTDEAAKLQAHMRSLQSRGGRP